MDHKGPVFIFNKREQQLGLPPTLHQDDAVDAYVIIQNALLPYEVERQRLIGTEEHGNATRETNQPALDRLDKKMEFMRALQRRFMPYIDQDIMKSLRVVRGPEDI